MHDLPIEPHLLLSLDALLQERHVSRAAARVGLTQSAMSRVLNNLREQLKDPLLVRSGRAMRLSARAEAMAGPLRRALSDLEHVLSDHQAFDPATSTRRFHLATADYGVAAIVVPLLARLSREAPSIDLRVAPFTEDSERELDAGTLDFVVAPRRTSAAGVVWSRGRSERFVSIVRRDHPGVGDTLDLATFCALTHVVVTAERNATSRVDELLAEAHRARRIGLTVPSFLAAPLAVASSDMIATTPESIARQYADAFGLRVLEPPVPLGPIKLAVGWHERHREEPGHAWLRSRIGAL